MNMQDSDTLVFQRLWAIFVLVRVCEHVRRGWWSSLQFQPFHSLTLWGCADYLFRNYLQWSSNDWNQYPLEDSEKSRLCRYVSFCKCHFWETCWMATPLPYTIFALTASSFTSWEISNLFAFYVEVQIFQIYQWEKLFVSITRAKCSKRFGGVALTYTYLQLNRFSSWFCVSLQAWLRNSTSRLQSSTCQLWKGRSCYLFGLLISR